MNPGIDIISIKKFRNLTVDDFEQWKKFFTEKEWKEAFSDESFSEHLAGTFAAKEAIMKASGDTGPKNYIKFEIIRGENGAPLCHHYPNVRLSISHSDEYAVALALIN